ncbi:MAG: hypothetical protein M1840_001935 [Geoglossum simile]|nr:MAG: hypothetical protein M1840_001935 [Geoglossum simile]
MSDRNPHYQKLRERDPDDLSSSRSRSPREESSHRRHRPCSPDRKRRHHHHHGHSGSHKRRQTHLPTAAAPVALPFNAKKLSKHDLDKYKAIFGLYLDIQKQLVLEDLDKDEVRGRWKRFVDRWNRGELAEGWYDPSTNNRAQESDSLYKTSDLPPGERRASPDYGVTGILSTAAEDEDSDDDVVGPTLPGHRSDGRKSGPTIPKTGDLELRREMEVEDRLAFHEDLRFSRKMDRKLQKEQLEELAPRADTGTRERQLEKKREVNDKMRAFREKSPVEEVGEAELMGDDGLDGFKKKKKEMERKKNERELRKEEMLRTRAAEREERLQEHREKEEKTMAMLRALARQNFG